MIVIGMDFGNYNSYVSFISDLNMDTRLGGDIHDLLPPNLSEGIPSVYFYSKKAGEICGEAAVRSKASPEKNRLRYLKRNLGKEITLDGKVISYDDAITAVIQYCVRSANKKLQEGWQTTTNLISLAYPATFSPAQTQKLIELAERATLKDGRHVKVFGTISEPAAAALDYLAEHSDKKKETTVLTYDLGGGTFDLALVAAYPNGRKNPAMRQYYYDVLAIDGLSDIGGVHFDDVMYQLLISKISVPLGSAHMTILKKLAERTKIDLSSDTEANPELVYNNDFLSLKVTRGEFEQASSKLLKKTVDRTKQFLQEHSHQSPELILLTGGASQMPMVKKTLEEAFPQYKGKIIDYRPSRAISYGAARFGTSEYHAEQHARDQAQSAVQIRTRYDIGIRYGRSQGEYIDTNIEAGTPIPFTGEFVKSQTLNHQQYSRYTVYEANKLHPDKKKIDRDFKEIMSVRLDHGRVVPPGTISESRLRIDRRGILTLEVRDPTAPNRAPISANVELKNLGK